MKKIFTRGMIILFIMLPVIAVAHFLIFPQETRCMLIRFADFKQEGNIYFRRGTNTDTVKMLQEIQSIAERKNKAFWGNNFKADYRIIYCGTEKDYHDYGRTGSPAATQRKCGVFVVLSKNGLDISVAAHELSHGILYNNIGWYKTTFKIPVWFDEGLAMQVDDRAYYSADTLMARKKAGVTLPDIPTLSKPGNFFSGDADNIILNFATAKFIVQEWLKTHSPANFIRRLNNGTSFENAFQSPD